MKTPSKRQLQVASIIQRNIGTILQQEGTYMYGDALVTVMSVKITPDMGIARVYLSVYNTNNKEAVIEVINHHLHRIRQWLATRVRKHLRRVPALEFYLDDTLDEMYRLNEVFDRIAEERKEKENPNEQDYE